MSSDHGYKVPQIAEIHANRLLRDLAKEDDVVIPSDCNLLTIVTSRILKACKHIIEIKGKG